MSQDIPLEILRFLQGPRFDPTRLTPAGITPTYYAHTLFSGQGPAPPELEAELPGLYSHIEQYLLDHPTLIPLPFVLTYRNIPPTPPQTSPSADEHESTNPPGPTPPPPPPPPATRVYRTTEARGSTLR